MSVYIYTYMYIYVYIFVCVLKINKTVLSKSMFVYISCEYIVSYKFTSK